MTTSIHQTSISNIEDSDFQSMIGELYRCTGFLKEDFHHQSLSFMLMEIARHKRRLTKQHVLLEGILTTKVNNLPHNSVVRQVCQELVDRKGGTHIDCFHGRTVLTLLNHCHKAMCPPPYKLKKLKAKVW